MPPTDDRSTRFAALPWNTALTLVQLLALCPLLAVATTAVNGAALGIAVTAVLLAANTAASLLRRVAKPAVRILLYLLILAALVTALDAAIHALFDDLHRTLGPFVPLILVNCGVLAQADAVASRRAVENPALSGLAAGLGFLAVLVALGALRESLGRGTLLAGLPMLIGEPGAAVWIDWPWGGMLAAALPPGAFFGIALLLALRNRLTTGADGRPPREFETVAAESTR